MNQTLHIFRKDLNHLWPEITASITILLLFCVNEPRTWPGGFAIEVQRANSGSAMLGVLLVLSWIILLLRLIHDERLAGTNQFWTTRPYSWPNLLAAKAIFAMLGVCLPLALAHLTLIHQAGLPLRPALPLMGMDFALLTSFYLLPAAAIGVVTRSLGQAILVVLGFAAGLTVFFFLLSTVFRSPLRVGPFYPIYGGWLEMALEVVLASGVIVWQYRRRSTFGTCVGFAGTAAVMLLVQQLLPGTNAAIYGFPPDHDQSTSVTLSPASPPLLRDSDGNVQFALKANIRGVPAGVSLVETGVRYTVTGADHFRFRSRWENARYVSGTTAAGLPTNEQTLAVLIELPPAVYDALRGQSITLDAELALTELRRDPTARIALQYDPSLLADRLARCGLPTGARELLCRSAYQPSPLYAFSSQMTDLPCPGVADDEEEFSVNGMPAATPPVGPVPAHGTMSYLAVPLPAPVISPVHITQAAASLALPSNLPPNGRRRPMHYCPDTQAQFTRTYVGGRLRLSAPPVTLPALVLP